eukprot:TRINITY_DN38168_c0_g1_i1.p1 TRINITY_DN38168_c0_g1~~TRINITY_DN38168_c0_g1_i1.p1  ORF type:complete len:323 (+),score=51.39 TRINITY_DN38168_c0_g1_i1:38-1006(+)
MAVRWMEPSAPVDFDDPEKVITFKGSEILVLGSDDRVQVWSHEDQIKREPATEAYKGMKEKRRQDGWSLWGTRVVKKGSVVVEHRGVVRDFVEFNGKLHSLVEVDEAGDRTNVANVMTMGPDPLPSLFNIFNEKKYRTSPLNEITGGTTYTDDTLPKPLTNIAVKKLCLQIDGGEAVTIEEDFKLRSVAEWLKGEALRILTAKGVYTCEGEKVVDAPERGSVLTGRMVRGEIRILTGERTEPAGDQQTFLFSPDTIVKNYKGLKCHTLQEGEPQLERTTPPPAHNTMDMAMLLAGFEAMLDRKLKPLEDRLEKLENRSAERL